MGSQAVNATKTLARQAWLLLKNSTPPRVRIPRATQTAHGRGHVAEDVAIAEAKRDRRRMGER